MSDLISRQDAINEIHKYFVEEIDKTPTEIDEDGDEVFADMPTVNFLLACNKELSKRIKSLPSAESTGAMDDAIQEYIKDGYMQPIGEDLISRQDAIRWVKTECNPYGKPTLDFESGKKVIQHLAQMPSADRPSGHWVLVNRGLDIYMCDQCREILQIDRVPIWDYCPLCGARMRGETDGRPNK